MILETASDASTTLDAWWCCQSIDFLLYKNWSSSILEAVSKKGFWFKIEAAVRFPA
jgi:hypothetical protein